jgi:hypothetical protein
MIIAVYHDRLDSFLVIFTPENLEFFWWKILVEIP